MDVQHIKQGMRLKITAQIEKLRKEIGSMDMDWLSNPKGSKKPNHNS